MKFRMKAALLLLSAGVLAMEGSCFFRWLGDLVGDTIVFRNVD